MKSAAATVLTLTWMLGAATAAGGPPDGVRHRAFQSKLERLDEARRSLFRELRSARGAAAKDAVRAEAKALLIRSIVDEIVPAWLGMPWTMAVIDDGLKPNAAYPFEEGKGVSCSWFVVSVLRNAGVRFVNPRDFAGTISIHFQWAMTPRKRDIHRYHGVTPKKLKQKLKTLGDGLYIVGLNCHIGFLHVAGDRVDFLHSSYIDPQEVVVEPVERSPAIEMSEDAGYVVSPLFQDRRLIDFWLSGTRIPFQKWSAKKKPEK